jgi:hypothetical protein
MKKEINFVSVATQYDAMIALGSIDFFYNYHNDIIQLWANMNRELVEKKSAHLQPKRQKKPTLFWGTANNQEPR